MSNTSYVLLEIFMLFVAVKAKVWWNNNGSSFFSETRCSYYVVILCYCFVGVCWQWDESCAARQ